MNDNPQPRQLSARARAIMGEAIRNLAENSAQPDAFEAARQAQEQAMAQACQYQTGPFPLPTLNADGGLAGDQQQGQT